MMSRPALAVILPVVLLLPGNPASSEEFKEFIGSSTISTIPSAIDCNFNSQPIVTGDHVWFIAAINPSAPTSAPVTYYFRHQTISFDAVFNSVTTHHVINVPDANVTFYPTAQLTCSNTQFTGLWETQDFFSGSGRTFLSGLSYQIPAGLGQIRNPVTWAGDFFASASGASLSWTWSAAVYNPFSTAYNSLGVKSTDANSDDCTYLNSHHVGAPENMLANLKPGATGGGGSNYTGSLCSSVSVPTPTPVQISTWGEVKAIYR